MSEPLLLKLPTHYIARWETEVVRVPEVHSVVPFLRSLGDLRAPCCLVLSIDGQVRQHLVYYDHSEDLGTLTDAAYRLVSGRLDGFEFSDVPLDVPLQGIPVLIELHGRTNNEQLNQVDKLVSGLKSAGIRATILVGLVPFRKDHDGATEKESGLAYLFQHVRDEHIEEVRSKAILTDYSFLTSFSIYLCHNDPLSLNATINVVQSLIASAYDSPSSNVHFSARVGEDALQQLSLRLWNQSPYPQLLSLDEVTGLFQFIPTPMAPERVQVKLGLLLNDAGGIQLGWQLDGDDRAVMPWRVTQHMLEQGVSVFGSPGSGKSNLLKLLAIKCSNQLDTPFLYFDPEGEAREILSRLNKKPLFLRFPTSFSFNLFDILEGLPRGQHQLMVEYLAEVVVDIYQSTHVAGDVQRSVIKSAVRRAIEKNERPTLRDVVSQIKGRQLTSVKERFHDLTEGIFARNFSSQSSTMTYSEFKDHSVIIDLGSLHYAQKAMVGKAIFHWDSAHWLQGSPSESTARVVLVDEAHTFADVTFTQTILPQARKYRQALVLATQGFGQFKEEAFGRSVLRDTNLRFAFSLGSSLDIQEFVHGSGLFHTNLHKFIPRQPRGRAVAKARGPSVASVQFDPWEQEEQINDWSIDECQPRESDDWELPHNPKRKLADEILELLADKPNGLRQEEIRKELAVGKQRIIVALGELIELGDVRRVKVRQGVGRPSVHYQATPQGSDRIEQDRLRLANQYGDIEHRLIRAKVADRLMNLGWEVTEESQGCDIKAEKAGHSIAVEIETGQTKSKQLQRNIERDSKWACHIVIVVPSIRSMNPSISHPESENSTIQVISYEASASPAHEWHFLQELRCESH